MWRNVWVACVLLILSAPAFAENVSIGGPPAWLFRLRPDLTKTPDERLIKDGYYLALVDNQTNIPAQEQYLHFIRQIVNQTGVQNASEISVNFVPDYQHVIFHQINLIRNGKIVSKLNLSQIKVVQEETEAGEFQYNGIKRAFVVLKDVRAGDRIDVSYTIVGFNPVFGGKFSDQLYFYSSIATANFFQTVITTKSHPLNFKYFNAAPSPRRFHHDDTLMYFWQDPPLNVQDAGNVSPSWYSLYNSVSISEFKNWKEVNDWGLALFKNYNAPLSSLVNNKIRYFQSQAKGDPARYIALATQFVQDQVRYLGFETGIYTHQPHDPGQVCEQRYGDCKDKAFLLALMLRAGGAKAYVALANTSMGMKLHEQDPSPDKFNHAIVAIEKEGKYQFIDPTIAYQRGPLNDLYTPAYGYALVLRTETTDLVPVTASGYRKSTIHEKLFVRYDGPTMLQVESDFEGGTADENRGAIAGAGLADLQKNYLRYYTKIFDSIESESEVKILDDTLRNKVHISERYRIQNIWRIDEKGRESMSAYAHPFAGYFPDPAHSYKMGPIGLSYPQDIHYTLELHMPDKWSFPADDYHISNAYYQFDFTVKQKDSIITLDYQFGTFQDYIPEDHIAAYREEYRKISSVLEYSLSKTTHSNNNTSQNTTGLDTSSQGINTAGLVVFLCTLGLMSLLFLYLNKRYVDTPYVPGTGQRLSGWVVFLGITLLLSILIQVAQFFTYNFFSLNTWNLMARFGGAGLQSLVLIEEMLNTALIAANIMVVYWFLKRRDIFPQMFVSLVLFKLGMIIALVLSYSLVPYPPEIGDVTASSIISFVRVAIYGAIWITFVLRSEQVKQTFIEPWQPPRSHQPHLRKPAPPAHPADDNDITSGK